MTDSQHKQMFSSALQHLLTLYSVLYASRQLNDWGVAQEAGTAGPGFHQ